MTGFCFSRCYSLTTGSSGAALPLERYRNRKRIAAVDLCGLRKPLPVFTADQRSGDGVLLLCSHDRRSPADGKSNPVNPRKQYGSRSSLSLTSTATQCGAKTGLVRIRREVLRLESVPRPVWDAQAVRHIISRSGISRHRCCSCPGEVVVQHLSQRFMAG